MNGGKIILQTIVVVVIVGLSLMYCDGTTAQEIPVEDKIAVLVTDWGTPNGFDENYYGQIGYRGSRGPAADPAIPPEEQTCIETYVGIWPYLSAMGIMPYAVSYYPSINDTSGIYRHLGDDTYENLLEPSIVITKEDGDAYEAAGDVLPASSLEAGLSRGRAFFGLDKRLGDTIGSGAVDHLEGIYKIIIPGGDGVNDLDESYNAYWVRLVAIMSIGFDVSMNPNTLIMEDVLDRDLHALFGNAVDIRFGNYEAVAGLTRREDDVAIDFAEEGFTKMLLTRETTDNNNYANRFMTYGYTQRGLCNAGYADQMDIKQVRQVGRTPEYNTMLVNTIRPAFERIPEGADVSVLYATYGLPYPVNKAAIDYQLAGDPISSFCTNHPWAQEVFAENAYNNYLSAKPYIELAFDLKYGGNYNLNFHKSDGSGECTSPDCRMNTLYGYSLYPPYPFYGYPEDPDRYQSLRDNIEALKAQTTLPKHILIALSHWYYNSGDTALSIRDMNNFPLSSEEDIQNGDFIMEWCEGETLAGPDETLTDRAYIESYVIDQLTELRGTFELNENGECPEGYTHIVIAEAFDEQMEDFTRGYASRIRGGIERYGVFPDTSLNFTIEAQGPITKLGGGTVTSTTGVSNGASIVVPPDPDPVKPDNLTYTDMYRPAGTTDPNLGGVKILNDPTDRWEAAWFEFTSYIGTQEKVLDPNDTIEPISLINLPTAPSGLTAVSDAIYVGPYRTLFNEPATITLPYDGSAVTTPDDIRPFVYNDITGDYDQIYPVVGGIDYNDDNNNIVLNGDGTASFSVQFLGIFVLAECPDCNYSAYDNDGIHLRIGDQWANCGDVGVKIPICLINLEAEIGAVQVDLCEDIDDCLICIGCEMTERTVIFDCMVNELENGCCAVVVFSKNPGGVINPGECDIVIIDYTLKDEPQCCNSCIEIKAENIEVVDQYGYLVDTLVGGVGMVCPFECGDVEPAASTATIWDCGDGDVDIFDILEEVDFIIHVKTPDACQAVRADVPTGTPPDCDPPDGTIDVGDLMVIIDMALNRQDCCSYYYGGVIY